MHQALYRKWRPQTFDEVYGQNHITDILRFEVANGKTSHAYLFCGSRGTGKTTCAKILARAVNCENPQNGNPCCNCAACRSIADGSATDILEMDAASNNKVDDIRTILDEVIFTPSALKFRVYIIDEVHMLTTSAFNALLKTLEEPPAHVIFILATTEMQKLPATIISRCQRFDFHRIPVPVLSARLKYIAEQEEIALEDDAALIISRLAQGGMRDAISLFELCAAGGKQVNSTSVSDTVGFSGRGPMSRVVRAVIRRDCNSLFRIIADTDACARDIAVFWQELIGYYRDLLVMKTAGRDNAIKYLDLTDSEADMISDDAKAFPREMLSFHCRLLDEAYAAMQRPGANRRTIAELTLVRLSDEKLSSTNEALLARIEALESKIASGRLTVAQVPAKPAEAATAAAAAAAAEPKSAVSEAQKTQPSSQPETAAVTAPAAVVTACAADSAAGGLKRIRRWSEVTEALRKTNPGVASLLMTSVAYQSGTQVVIKFRVEVTKRLATAPETFGNLCAVLSEVLEMPVGENDVVFEQGSEEDLRPEDPGDALSSELNKMLK